MAICTHRSDIGKEALKILERNWEREDMQGYVTEQDRSLWVNKQLNGSSFLYKVQDDKVRIQLLPMMKMLD